MKKGFSVLIVLIIAVFSLNSCFKEDVVLDFDELTKIDRALNFEGPLVNAKFYAVDLIDRMGDSIGDFVEVADDGFMSIKYKDSIHTAWDEIVDLEPVNETVTMALNKKSTKAEETLVKRIKLNTAADQRFDSLIVDSSTMSLTISFPNNVSGPVTVSFPELTKNGQILVFEFEASQGSSSASEDLKGYKIIFKHAQDSSYINMVMTSNLSSQGNPNGSTNLTLNMQMTRLVPEIMFGYFGQKRILDRAQTMYFDFFEEMRVVDLIEFYDIKLLVEFYNYFGIPYDGTLADAVVIRKSTNQTLPLNLEDNTAYVPGADYAELVTPTFNSMLYTKDNSNIGDVVNLFPDRLDYRLQIDINPNGEEELNFVTDNNSIAGNTYLIIPLWMRTDQYFRYDTIHNFGLVENRDSSQLAGIESAELYFTLHNGFPFEMDAQFYVADENYNIVDSLFSEDQRLLETGTLDEDDKVIERSETEVTVYLTGDQLVEYKGKGVNKLLFLTKTSTAYEGERFVKMYDFYGVSFELNAKLTTTESN